MLTLTLLFITVLLYLCNMLKAHYKFYMFSHTHIIYKEGPVYLYTEYKIVMKPTQCRKHPEMHFKHQISYNGIGHRTSTIFEIAMG